MVIAAGIFIINKENKLLVAHPTRQSKNDWSIPKGKVEDGEEMIDAAIRETYEETNIALPVGSVFYKLEPVRYPKTKKIINPFVFLEKENDFDLNDIELKCNSHVPEDKGGFPEMDEYKWITLDEAEKQIHVTQAACIPDIKKILKINK